MPDDDLEAIVEKSEQHLAELQLSAHAAQVALEARAMIARARPRAARDYAQAALALVQAAEAGLSCGGDDQKIRDTAMKCREAVERILAEDESVAMSLHSCARELAGVRTKETWRAK